jgi:hypothetical protein
MHKARPYLKTTNAEGAGRVVQVVEHLPRAQANAKKEKSIFNHEYNNSHLLFYNSNKAKLV